MAHKGNSDCTRRTALMNSPKAEKSSWAYYAFDGVCVVVIPDPIVVNSLGIEYLGWIGD